MAIDDAAAGLLRFLEESGDAPEVLWAAALAMLERAIAEAGEGRWARFRHYPRGQLRNLRHDLASGLRLALLAVALQEAEADAERGDLSTVLAQRAAAAAKRRKVAKGLPVTNFHLEADYPAAGNPST
jgi:hypothetical protein